ncbi:MAG: T9SS type A sorting domain-containing protein, partial [Flavobacterium sp.]|uniref:T9SS type A sorting domain-containing protein n=1 Tax=Flavobacterium sp. TaxID=239 RepID=UPI0025C4ECCB
GYNYYNVDTYWTNNPNLDFVCVDDSEMVIIQQIVTQSALLININSYCSFTPGGDYNTITGLVQYDFNQNGCDVLDFPANYTRIDVNLDGVSTNSSVFSNGVGVYNLYTSTTGVYNLVPNIENPSFFNVSPISADVPVMTIDNSVATQNFCITANGVHPDLEIVIAPIIPARPGFTAEYQIVYRNKGNQVMSQLYGVNFFYNQNLMSFVSATQVPSSIVSGGMSWDFANLLPFESRSINVVMQINAPTDTNPVNIGDVLQFTSSIMPMAGDEYTVDNLFQLNQTVVGSYDPNDITCIQGNIVAPSYIGEYLHYVINFENTGTAPAENVVVKIEVNPNDFDINSLRILESSHNATIKINNNILEIIFQTIMLDTGGHGNVLLKVKSKENLVLNDIVTKNAKIYFDYNFPIVTNDANTIFQALSNAIPIKDLSISLYPNPTSSLLNIKAENRIKSVELYDVQGRIIQVNKADSNEVLIDVSVCNSGVYFVKVTTDFGSQIKKVVKE